MTQLLRFTAGVFFIAASLSTAVRAQDDEKVTVSSNLVTVNITVTDSRGWHVMGLTGKQFEIYVDGVRQPITHFSAAGDAPFSLGVVYDLHPTTRERASVVLRALKRFTAVLGHDDDFFLLVFNERASAALEFVPTAEQIGEHLAFIPPREPNSLYDAVYLAAEKLHSRPRVNKALLVISDGIDHGSRHSYSELRRRVGEFDVQLYGIDINELYDSARPGTGHWMFEDITRRTGRRVLSVDTDAALGQAALAEGARASGGASYVPQTGSEGELFSICAQMALEMRRHYTIGFYPAGALGGSRWHKIHVRVIPSAVSFPLYLSYREGYWPRKS